MSEFETALTRDAKITFPIICGAMYPCSNPELVAAASEAGGIGIVQPLSLVYVHGYDFREGLKYIKTLTNKPVGFNILVEKSSKIYEDRMRSYVDIAIEEGFTFFITALGNPSWVIDKARQVGGKVYHDVTEDKWAKKAIDYGVDGLICVNSHAGGHAGGQTAAKLIDELKKYGKPLICAGGIGSKKGFEEALELGYDGIQMGTRFIAAKECKVHPDYSNAIVNAKADDIVLSERITGVPVAVIATEHVKRMGTEASVLAKWMLKGKKTKHLMRIIYALRSGYQLKKALHEGSSYKDYFQAGKSVEDINQVLSVAEIFDEFTN